SGRFSLLASGRFPTDDDRDTAALERRLRESRRQFLVAAGRFAAVTPPTVTLLLAASAQNFAVAVSGSPSGTSSTSRSTSSGTPAGRILGPDNIPPDVHPGDTVCFHDPVHGGVECHGIPTTP